MSERKISSDEGIESFKGFEANVSFSMTQCINESESQLDERLSEDTYCSMNRPIDNSENLEKDELANGEAETSVLAGVKAETTVGNTENGKPKEIDSSMEVEMIDRSADCITDDSATGDTSKEMSTVRDDSMIASDTDRTRSLIEEEEDMTTPEVKTTVSSGAVSSPALFSEAIGAHEPVEVSSTEVTPKSSSVLTITDTSSNTSLTESGLSKRKAESKSNDETPAKKSRQSCMVIYEGTPQRKEPLATFDLTKECSPPEEITILDETQNDFSLRLDSQTVNSPNEEKDTSEGSTNTWKSHKNISTENGNICEHSTSWMLHMDKESHLSWESHKENSREDYAALKSKYDEVVKEKCALQAALKKMCDKDGETVKLNAISPDSNSSKESLYTFMETCFMCGIVLFTVNEATNHLVSAEVKQLSLLGHPGKDKKQRSSLSSGCMADKSFSSGESSVSMPGPFTLPTSRCSILSTTSSSSSSTSVLSSASAYAKATEMRNFDGPFLVPSAPVLKNIKDTISQPLSCFGHTLPPVQNVDDFLHSCNLVNGSPELLVGNVAEKISKFESRSSKSTAKDIETNRVKETIVQEKEEEEGTEEQTPVVAVIQQHTPQRRGRGRKPSKSVTPAKTKLSTPVKTTKFATLASQKVTEEEVLFRAEGKPVFAKWSDSQYYPGWVNEDMNNSRIKVHFCDGNVNILSSVKVIPADWLKPGRVALAQHRGKVEYSPCLVMNMESGGRDGPVYIIDGDSSANKVNFTQIGLTETQVAEIREEAIATGRMSSHHLVSLDNVLNHPRTRTPRTPVPNTTPKTSTPSRKKAKEPEPSTSKGLTRSASTSSDMTEDTDGSTMSSMTTESIRGNEGVSLDPECSPQEFPFGSKRKTSQQKHVKSTKKSKKVLEEDLTMEQNYGPLPEEGSKIFAGCNFLLTYTTQKRTFADKRKVEYSSSDGVDQLSTGDEEWFQVKMFNKQRLRIQIKRGGGKLYRILQHVPQNEYSDTYLITDAPSCTPLYLQCLVYGISIYNHKSIIECCKENRPFKQIEKDLLPAGWSLERTVYRHQQKNVKPFKKLKGGILLAVSQNKALLQFWRKLLLGAMAKVFVHNNRVTNLDEIAVIVTDIGCSDDLINLANKNSVPVVSLVWAEQCIIDGGLRPFNGHPEYSFNNITEPKSPEY